MISRRQVHLAAPHKISLGTFALLLLAAAGTVRAQSAGAQVTGTDSLGGVAPRRGVRLASIKHDLRELMTAEEKYFSEKAMYATANRLIKEGYATLSPDNTIGAMDAGSATGYTISVTNPTIRRGKKECVVYSGNDATAAGKVDGVISCQ